MIKVIVVEDEYRARTGLVKMIESLSDHYRVIGSAENGYEGMLLARDLQPDVIFADIQMPRINGLEMIQNLQATGKPYRFVIISGYADFEYAQQGIRLGVIDYLLKPITITAMKDLLGKIEKEMSDDLEYVEEVHEVNQYTPMIQEIVQSIKKHYGEKITLEQFAYSYAVTPEYLSSVFSKQLGCSFVRYLKEIRMNHAKQLLCTSNKKIYEIAFEVGYPDVKYFCRIFKGVTGLSPKEYVRQYRKE